MSLREQGNWLNLRAYLEYFHRKIPPISIPKDVPMACKSLRDSMIIWGKQTSSFDLLILAPQYDASGDSITEELKPLAEHKNNTGIGTLIRSLEHIYQVCSGNDEAEKVKQYIWLFRGNWRKYVMLVGAGDIFPVRFTRWEIQGSSLRACLEWGCGIFPPISIPNDVPMACKSLRDSMISWCKPSEIPRHKLYVPTDLYYACLSKPKIGGFDDWDWNKNGEIGEVPFWSSEKQYNPDNVSVIPSVAIGRVLASTAQQVRNYVNKVKHYETTSRRKRVLTVLCTDCAEIAEIVNKYDPNVFTLSKKDEDPNCPGNKGFPMFGYFGPYPIKYALNVNGFGFLIWQGHGGRGSWGLHSEVFTLADVADLTNFDVLPIMFAGGSCDTAKFTAVPPQDPFIAADGKTYEARGRDVTCPKPACLQTYKVDQFENMAREMTIKNANGGAIVYIGCTITGGYPYKDLLDLFLEAAYEDRVNPGRYPRLGDIWITMIRGYYDRHHLPSSTTSAIVSQYMDWFLYPWRMCLFGDPSLRVAGAF
ncbi:MAG: C25 family cysteine peptidase [Methanotrichaceae archaeon]|nr:C25 family cysteine peptidase [Methanotrichaceae archaeon]